MGVGLAFITFGKRKKRSLKEEESERWKQSLTDVDKTLKVLVSSSVSL